MVMMRALVPRSMLVCFVTLLWLCAWSISSDTSEPLAVQAARQLRETFYPLFHGGYTDHLLRTFEELLDLYGTLDLDDELPSLYNLQGVLYFYLNRNVEAHEAFRKALLSHPDDLRAAVNFNEVTRSIYGDNKDSIAIIRNLTGSIRLADAMDSAHWHLFEVHETRDEKNVFQCVHVHRNEDQCDADMLLSDYSSISPRLLKEYSSFLTETHFLDRLSNVQKACALTNHQEIINFGVNMCDSEWQASNFSLIHSVDVSRHVRHAKIRLAVMLLKNDHNPVNVLSFSLFRHLPRERIELVGIMLNGNEDAIVESWQIDFYKTFDRIFHFAGLDSLQAAVLLKNEEIDVLLDMTGLSLSTSLAILSYHPALVQALYLGESFSSGSPFIDYFIGDVVSNSVESMRNGFSESFALLQSFYMANSHSDTQRDNVIAKGRMKRSLVWDFLQPGEDILNNQTVRKRWSSSLDSPWTESTIFFGAFNGWVKIDPSIFHVWMNVMRAVPRAAIVFCKWPHLLTTNTLSVEARSHGVLPSTRVAFLPLSSLQKHLHVKSGFDIFLDTIHKNGHTTTLDAQYAGLPVVALGGSHFMNRRSSQASTHTNDNDFGIVFSLKEYEDLVIWLFKDPTGCFVYEAWKEYSEKQRENGKLFDAQFLAKKFAEIVEGMFEARLMSLRSTVSTEDRRKRWQQLYHIFEASQR